MSTQENKAIVRRFFEEAWNQNKIAELDAYVAADNVGHAGSVVRSFGPEAVRTTIKVWRTAFPDYQAHLEALTAEGDMVVARITFTGTHTGLFQLGPRVLPPTGKALREAELIMFRIADGKIVELWATWDRLSVLEQLGALLEPTPA
jgi:predicted ester cyclase